METKFDLLSEKEKQQTLFIIECKERGKKYSKMISNVVVTFMGGVIIVACIYLCGILTKGLLTLLGLI